MAGYKPPLVMSVHGIRTHAKWQKVLDRILGKEGIPPCPYDYDYYGLNKFLNKFSNDKMVDAFHEQYTNWINQKGWAINKNKCDERPSIIAHSFGTYIVGNCLLKYEDVRFDKVILCGSVLDRRFDWSTIMGRDQVNYILNEYGKKDFWTKVVGAFVPDTGSSGTNGFDFLSNYFIQIRHDYFKHSDYFEIGHIEEHWLPFLKKQPPIPLRIINGSEVVDEAQFDSLISCTRRIDVECYSKLPVIEEFVIPPGLSRTWIRAEPDIYTYLVGDDSGTAFGYINAMCLDDTSFEKIKNGTLKDNQITEENIVPFVSDKAKNLYIMSIAVEERIRKVNQGLMHEALEKLIAGLIQKLIRLNESNNLVIEEIAAIGWTHEGRQLSKLLGMRKIGEDKYGHQIYGASLEDAQLLTKSYFRHRGTKRLFDHYHERKH